MRKQSLGPDLTVSTHQDSHLRIHFYYKYPDPFEWVLRRVQLISPQQKQNIDLYYR